MNPIRRFAAFMLLMGFGLGLAALAFLSWHKGDTWAAIRETVLAASTVLLALWLVRSAPLCWLRAVREDFAKRRPLQFSMRRMFVVVTIICVKAGLFSALANHFYDSRGDGIAAMMLLVVGVSTLASGVILRKPITGAIWGAAALIVAMAWILIWGRHS